MVQCVTAAGCWCSVVKVVVCVGVGRLFGVSFCICKLMGPPVESLLYHPRLVLCFVCVVHVRDLGGSWVVG